MKGSVRIATRHIPLSQPDINVWKGLQRTNETIAMSLKWLLMFLFSYLFLQLAINHMHQVYNLFLFLASIVSFKEWHLKAECPHKNALCAYNYKEHSAMVQGKTDERRAARGLRLMSRHIEKKSCHRHFWKVNIPFTLFSSLPETPVAFLILTFDNFGNSNGQSIC